MTNNEMIQLFQTLTGEHSYDILTAYLNLAASKVLSRCYPFGNQNAVVPEKYQPIQIEIAVYLYNKRGAEGQLSHNENGINRSYESASVPESMLKGIVPFASAVGGNNEVPETE